VASCTEILIASILGGGCIILIEAFEPVSILKLVEKKNITFFGQPPVLYMLEMKMPEFWQMDWSHVKSFGFAGAAPPKMMIDVLNDICQKTGAVMFTGYGSTETCGFITYSEKGDDLETLMKTAGKIAPPFELKIVNDQRQEVKLGEVGEIAVRGGFLMKRYLNKPEETAKVIDAEGWYYTSDLASQDERGYITISGRKSDMFKTGAENVFPLEIETVLETHPGVLFAAVFGVPDEIYQEVGWAFVMLKPEQTATEEELRALCKSQLANFKVPKRFFIRPLLPLTPIGKVDKVSLRAEAREILKQEKGLPD
jgi:fatty-acyl-CoA synthase